MKAKFALLAVGLCAWFSASAASFTNLYTFSATGFGSGPNPPATNSDGANPECVILSGNTLYGTAYNGGLYGDGSVFRIDTDGTHFTNLFNFNVGTYVPATGTYADSTGQNPNPGLVLISNTLYGTCHAGAKFGVGDIFKINTDGSGFGLITTFDFTNGAEPMYGLTYYSNAVYGDTSNGTNTYGDIFKYDLSGGGFAKLYQFENLIETYGGVAVSSNQIYGICRYEDSNPNGFIYKLGTGGFVDLMDFDGTNGNSSYATPLISGDTMYGVTYQGGTNGDGNVFRIDLSGQHFTNLYNFTAANGANTDGAYPYDFTGLVLANGKLYGTTSVRGSGGQGTVFQLNTDGTGFALLHSFEFSDGGEPVSLVYSNGTLYGAAQDGGMGTYLGDGGIFALTLQPTLNIAATGSQAVLSWSDASYSLYSGTSVTNISTPVTGASSPWTVSTAGASHFYQLRSN